MVAWPVRVVTLWQGQTIAPKTSSIQGVWGGDIWIGKGLNYQLNPADFPLRRLSNPNDRRSTVLADTNDVVSSQGVFGAQLTNVVPGKGLDGTTSGIDPHSNLGGVNVRRVEPRNTPSVVNAVFNYRNFWDGRAQHEFNGRNPFGDRDPNARVAKVVGSQVQLVKVRLMNSSLASQAVGPPLSPVEMSAGGRSFGLLGRKMLSARPLAQQQVAKDDSVLGGQSQWPLPGLRSPTYRQLIQAAFQDSWWNNNSTIVRVAADGTATLDPNPGGKLGASEFTLMEYNFPLFFGLAVQAYEATLVANDSPFDRFLEGQKTALTTQQKQGLDVFKNKGKCINCHGGAELTNASVRNVRNQPLERMVMGDRQVAVYDNGFYNIAVRPIAEDVGVGGRDPFGKPLSMTALAQQQVAAGATAPIVKGDPDDNIPDAPLKPQERIAVQGAFKTPGLRNIALTAPYFHNGGQLTLRQVVEFYNRGSDFRDANLSSLDPDIEPLGLNETEKSALVSFLEALTDERSRLRKAPFDHPQLFLTNGHPGDTTRVTNDGRGNATDTLVNIPAVGQGGGGPLPRFLEGVAAAAAPAAAGGRSAPATALQGSVTQLDCPAGSSLTLLSGGYVCLPRP